MGISLLWSCSIVSVFIFLLEERRWSEMAKQYKMLKHLGLDEPAPPVEKSRKMSKDEEWDYVQKKYPFVPPTFLAKINFMKKGMWMTRAAIEKVQDPYYIHGPRILFQWQHEDF